MGLIPARRGKEYQELDEKIDEELEARYSHVMKVAGTQTYSTCKP